MIVYNKHTTGSEQAHFRYFNFERFVNGKKGTILIDSPQIFTNIDREFLENNKIVYLELEEPNRFLVNEQWFHHMDYDRYFDSVLSICPYTVNWYNSLGNFNREHTFIPINRETIPRQLDKKYDIIYAGHIVSPIIQNEIEIISRFNYRFVSNTNSPLVTDKSSTNKEKLRLMSETKITLTHGLLYPTAEHIRFCKTIRGITDNESFSKIDEGIMPQIKGRTFEAALCKSLILCKKDFWNVIEFYFTPDVDFVYYTPGKLEETIKGILNDYQDYEGIIESAYRKAQEYTVESFFKKYLKVIQ